MELARKSKARRAAEAAQLKQENEDLRARYATAGAYTDIDIMDEEAGKMRIVLADESKSRKEAEQEKLNELNRAYFDRIARMTDPDRCRWPSTHPGNMARVACDSVRAHMSM